MLSIDNIYCQLITNIINIDNNIWSIHANIYTVLMIKNVHSKPINYSKPMVATHPPYYTALVKRAVSIITIIMAPLGRHFCLLSQRRLFMMFWSLYIIKTTRWRLIGLVWCSTYKPIVHMLCLFAGKAASMLLQSLT